MRSLTLVPILCALALTTSPALADDRRANEPPALGTLTITPDAVGVDGGAVDLSIPVTDADGTVTTVVASASSAYGGLASATLGTSGGDVWTGVLHLPASVTGDPDSWSVEITALDDADGSATEVLGSIQQGGQPQFDQLPVVSDVTVDPLSLPASGGPVQLGATATDDHSVSDVVVAIDEDDGDGEWGMTLGAVSATRYTGTWYAPANASSVPRVYTLLVTATDDIGQQRFVNGGQVTVAGVVGPDDPVDDPPEITGASVTPTTLTSEGGVVDVLAQATDDRGIASVRVAVSGPGIVPRSVSMLSTGTGSYAVSVQLPSNASVVDAAYSFALTVTDTGGAVDTADLPDVVVTGLIDDDPPPASDLDVSPGSLRLRAVGEARRVEGTVTLTNTGVVAAVAGTLGGLSAPFWVKGDEDSFHLAAGEQVVVTIVFRARETGRFVDRLSIVRDDGRQPDLGVRVVGRAR